MTGAKDSSALCANGQYLVVQAALPGARLQNIGVLLIDVAFDRLYCRFRRDRFNGLSDELSHIAKELGAGKCVEWLESTLSSAVRISTRRRVRNADCGAKAVDGLYRKHIRPKVLPFRTHLPQYTLEAAAGMFGKQMVVEPQGWVEVFTGMPLTDDMFVLHVKGHSMEPQIPNDSLCAFRSTIIGPEEGKVLLIEQCGESGEGRFTVKLLHTSRAVDPSHQGDRDWLHPRVTLESINPTYESWDVGSAERIKVLGEFLFVV
jgi:SOS-response transcriptional repressor LexA